MPLTEGGDRLAYDPAVDGRHEAMALRLRKEGIDGLYTSAFVGQAQQNLAPRTCGEPWRQRKDRLSVQLKAALVHCVREALDPSTLRQTLERRGRPRSRDMDP